ncbi:MAG: response regulator transcription factor [Raoultibacter sp.]|jgi:DNA-binding NarL/FixJ family response regulator
MTLITKKREEANFEASCLQVAKNGELSPREVEVFMLLVAGKDRADIREELFISNDTVKSHTRRIYSKLDIHSKKEARELVDQHIERENRGMNN